METQQGRGRGPETTAIANDAAKGATPAGGLGTSARQTAAADHVGRHAERHGLGPRTEWVIARAAGSRRDGTRS